MIVFYISSITGVLMPLTMASTPKEYCNIFMWND